MVWKKQSKESKQEEMKKIMQELEEGVKGIFTSNKFKEYLITMSKFHKYSPMNIYWILSQKKDATQIAGFKTWKELGRTVIKGEKSLRVLAPMKHSKEVEMEKIDPKTNKPYMKDGKVVTEVQKVEWISYRAVPVFDISQTEGKELPSIVSELKGKADHFEILKKAIESTAKVPINFINISGGAKGYFDLKNKKIAIQEGMSEAQTLKTMIHELTHSRLHDVNGKEEAETFDRKSAEVQAESVAFVVSNYFGLDTSEYSFGYVAGWSSGKEFKELNASLGIIKNEADKIISEMEEVIEKELGKEQNKEEVKKETLEQKQSYPYVEIEWSEGGYFKEGEILSLSEANKRFETYEKEVENLKNEYAAKGDYYPYFKTKLHLHIKENEDHVMRFDIGDGDKNLKEFVGKELKIYFNKDELDKLFAECSEKQQDKVLSLDDKIKMAEEKCKQNTRSTKVQNKDKEYEK